MKFIRRALVAVAAAAGLSLAAGVAFARSNDATTTATPSVTQHAPSTAVKTGYAQVNGLSMYYEVHGQAQGQPPLVLIHGALGTIDGMFGQFLPGLTKDRRVIAVELQAHGHTGDIDRPFSYELMADDIYALLQQLNVKQADIMGYSLGGGVALQTAIRHPESVRKLVIMSAVVARGGWFPEMLTAMDKMGADLAPMLMQSPIYEPYKAVAPRPEAYPALLEKLGNLVRQNYDWSKDVATIQSPAMVIAGDADGVRLDHAAQMFSLLGGTKIDHSTFERSADAMLIVPGADHFSMVFEQADVIVPAVSKFLAKPMPTAQ